jgi:hypothetical protein
VFPLAVAGILLFGVTATGILRESGYIAQTWRVLAVFGGVFALLGAALVATQVSPGSVAVADVIADPNGIVGRGLAVAVAGVMLVAAGATGAVAGRDGF